MLIQHGQLYWTKSHIDSLKNEPDYVQRRYQAVMKYLLSCGLNQKEAATTIEIKERQFRRLVKRFREEGISALRHRSKRPKNSPNQTPSWIEDKVCKLRENTGFGPAHLSKLINISLVREGKDIWICEKTAYNILVRRGIIEAERRKIKEWRRFEWGHPNRLIQADLTLFNGIPILTTEDDYSRKGWALRLANRKDKTVVKGLKKLLKFRYDNLLTDNGSQFNRTNKEIREYCDDHINEKHIWTSVHHPQTLGKLSAFQKGLKRFLQHKLGTSRDIHLIDHYIDVYLHWYNNGRHHKGIDNYPEVRYSGKRDEEWYEKLVKELKLEEVLTV
jgi:transposase